MSLASHSRSELSVTQTKPKYLLNQTKYLLNQNKELVFSAFRKSLNKSHTEKQQFLAYTEAFLICSLSLTNFEIKEIR